MSDGWSDKSISPAVYTPAAANAPQLEIDAILFRGQFVNDIAAAEITTKVSPGSPLFFESHDCSPLVVPAASTPNPAVLVENDAGVLFSTYSGTPVKVFRFDTDYSNTQIATVTTPSVFAANWFLSRNFGSGRLVIAGAKGRAYIIQSTDHGASWVNGWDTGAITGLAIKQMTAADSSGVYVLSGFRTIGAVAQPVCVRITGWGDTVTVIDMPAVSGMTAAAFYGMGCVRVSATVIVLCAQPASGNAYIFVSTNNGINWAHVHTTSGTTFSSAGSYGHGKFLGNGACAFFHLYGSGNGKVLVVEGSGTVFNLRSTPNNIMIYNGYDRQDYTRNTGMFQDGYAYGMGYTGTYSYFGIYVTTDYCQNWTRLTDQIYGGPGQLIQSEAENNLKFFYANLQESTATSATEYWIRINKTGINVERFVTIPTTAAFTATSPAKLASLGDVTPQLVTASKQGTVKLYLQHYNDEIGAWSSLADVADVWSDCGTLTDNTPLSLPAHTCRAGEQFRFKIGFTPTDPTGIQAAPELESLSFIWSSDVTAPNNPSITRIISTTISGQAGYRVDFGALPDGARHVILEGQINSDGYSPFNNKAAFAAGNHMRFRGSRDVIEEAGERNELNAGFLNGLTEGDVVQVKIAAEDNVGNRSAFVESDPITLAVPTGGSGGETVFVPVFTSRLKFSIREQQRFSFKIRGQ